MHLWNRDGSPHAEYSMHERCKDEMLGMNPGLAELIPEIDLDECG